MFEGEKAVFKPNALRLAFRTAYALKLLNRDG
jgi:hypothetical protein